jgi:uncharacterized membrane-anchored protein
MNESSERVRNVCLKTSDIGWPRIAVAIFAALVAALSFSPSIAAAPAAAASGAPAPSAAEPGSAEDGNEASLWQAGPSHVDLGHDIALDLPVAYAFLPKEPAAKALEANGSLYNENLLGIIAGADHGSDWFVVLRYDAEGYVKDDESVDADEILSGLKEGTEEANEERKKRGFSPLTIDGWAEAPRYDKAQHHLVWALLVSDPEGKSVNFNTRILGRHGFVSLNLVTEPTQLSAFKPHAASLLAVTKFSNGARYEDFDSKTDKVAEYGLAGLVMAGAGLGAAKLVKLGLLAKFWKVLLAVVIAGKKFIVVAVIAIGVFLKRLFAKKNEQAAQ